MRNRWITTLVIIAVVTVTTVVVQTTKAEPAQATSLPTGADYRCKWRWYGITPYRSCLVLVQPGTVVDAKEWHNVYQGSFVGAFTGLAGAMCAPAGPYIAVVCMSAGSAQAASTYHAFDKAVEQRRCVIFRWIELPGIPYPLGVNAKTYGQRQRWLADTVNIDGSRWEVWRWGNPDSCQTRDACVSIDYYRACREVL